MRDDRYGDVEVDCGIVGRNPCPSCGGRPHYLAGIVIERDPKYKYLACFPCNMLRMVKRGEEWQASKLPKRTRAYG